jgi:two-component system chemotaxis response regulator CheB
MPRHDIIVIGGSAGAIEPLKNLVKQFPPDFTGAVFVVLHSYPRTRSLLPEILSGSGPLRALLPEDGNPIQSGRIYVAPPDHHLVIERDHIHLNRGPKEQHQRPSINVTFRSAALAYSDRVVGVILTGQMDDGTAGLWEIKRRGGIAVVQNPEEALYPSMPLSALREIEADHTVGIAGMGQLLCRLAKGEGEERVIETGKTDMEPRLTDLTCPDCRGTIWEVPRGNGSEYRCRVGHTYSPKTMLAEHFATQEKALYAAVVALHEGASLATRLADHFDPEIGEKLREEARERGAEAEVIRSVLRDRRSFSLE